MKVIIAGTRTFNDYLLLKAEVNTLIAPGVFDREVEVVSGTAAGADQLGEVYAREYGFKITRFPADWKQFGKSAGYLRNLQMAEYASHCICFWDGKSKGTKMMIDIANKQGLITHVVNYAP